MNRNMFKMNQNNNDEDSKRLQDVVGRNQTRNFNSPFFHGNDGSLEGENISSGSDISEGGQGIEQNDQLSGQAEGQSGIARPSLSSLVGKSIPFVGKKGQGGNPLGGSLVGEIFGFNKVKLLLIGSSFFAIVIFMAAIVGSFSASSANRIVEDQVIKMFTSIKNENDSRDSEWDLPEVGDMGFDEYFNKYVKKKLLKYLKANGYCNAKSDNSDEKDKVDCTQSDAYAFYKRFMEVTYAFEKKGYPIDTGLIYETMAYYRSDEELFSGSLQKQKVTGWSAWIKSLFQGKTDEISKLANKMWREFYIYDEKGNIIGTEWRRSLDKYVAYLMYGDSMHDRTEDPKVGTDNDLNIEGVSSSSSGEAGELVSGSHSYKYGNCSASDSDYEGKIEEGYIYNRFKDTHLLHKKKGKKLEEAITIIIQQIFDDTIKMYGAPSYCGASMGVGEYVPGSCSALSISHTDFTKEEFIKKVEAFAASSSKSAAKLLARYASEVYDMSVQNNINPEMVYIRANVEGYSPGGATNNFWGIGSTNNETGHSYPSVMKGVEAFIKLISRYKSTEEMMKHYATLNNIKGNTMWYAGSSSLGGCYYINYILKYYDPSPDGQAAKAAAKNGCETGNYTPFNKYDYEAYSKYQIVIMSNNHRKRIFGKGPDVCNESASGITGTDLGSRAAKYAIETFDSYGYSQDTTLRWSNRYVDCSSMVFRTYNHFKINFGGASTATGELQWCQKNNKMVKESELRPGDLCFTGTGDTSGHVEMYIGNGKTFGAHSAHYAWDKQVSISNFKRSGSDQFTRFCRPY